MQKSLAGFSIGSSLGKPVSRNYSTSKKERKRPPSLKMKTCFESLSALVHVAEEALLKENSKRKVIDNGAESTSKTLKPQANTVASKLK